MKNKLLGSMGEQFASDYLTAEGYKILEKNFNCSFGEVDLICEKNRRIGFVEVKTRSNREFGFPGDCIDERKQRKMELCAKYYMKSRRLNNMDYGLDVMEILIEHYNDI